MTEFIYYCTISGSSVHELPYGMDEEHPDCISLKLALSEKITELCNNGIIDFYTNCEYGFSLWAAEAIVGMRGFREKPARLHIVVPFNEQVSKWHKEVRERYFKLHETADSVTVYSDSHYKGCYYDADRYMLNNSITLLTDGNSEYLEKHAANNQKRIEFIFSCNTV